MGRKKALTKKEVFSVTGDLLREEGLHSVHFKNLAERLDVGRSTLYEYFKNKDELLLAYMKSLMDEMNQKVDEIPDLAAPNEKLHRLLIIILHHAQLHQIDKMIKDLQSDDKQSASFYKNELHFDLMKTYELMMKWIHEAKSKGIWRKDIDSGLIGDIIFHSILFPNRENLSVPSLASQLFGMIESGVCVKK